MIPHGDQQHSTVYTPQSSPTAFTEGKRIRAGNRSQWSRWSTVFMSRPVDAIVLEYHLGLLDGSVIAARIKQVRPTVPIVMLTDHLELPDGALKSVDALVTKSDGVQFLMATVHFLLSVRPARSRKKSLGGQTTVHLRHPGRKRGGAAALPANAARAAMHEMDVPLSPGVWRSILNGKIQF
jgi:DNA-binding response OmpR family regulator